MSTKSGQLQTSISDAAGGVLDVLAVDVDADERIADGDPLQEVTGRFTRYGGLPGGVI